MVLEVSVHMAELEQRRVAHITTVGERHGRAWKSSVFLGHTPRVSLSYTRPHLPIIVSYYEFIKGLIQGCVRTLQIQWLPRSLSNPGVVAHTCNLRTEEAESGRLRLSIESHNEIISKDEKSLSSSNQTTILWACISDTKQQAQPCSWYFMTYDSVLWVSLALGSPWSDSYL